MKSRISGEHIIDILFPLALLLVFFSTAVMTVLLAANVYQQNCQRSALAHASRTVTAYLTEKIHQGDENGGVYLENWDGMDVLVVEHSRPEGCYRTCIYYYDGMLREVMVPEGTRPEPEWGREMMALQDFRGEQLREGLFRFVCTDENGSRSSACVAVRSAGE